LLQDHLPFYLVLVFCFAELNLKKLTYIYS
jgi:hypothetical protein